MNFLSKAWNFGPLQGKKTYLSAFLLVIAAGLYTLGYINQQTYQVLLTVLGALGLASVRSAIQ